MKRAIIVGGSSGIGKEMALYFSQQGWKIAVLGRRKSLLDELCLEHENMFSYEVDINEAENLSNKLEKIVGDLGGLDLFIISAGTGFLNNELDFSKEYQTVKTNVESFTKLVGWGYHIFKQQGHGQIVAITSVQGLMAGGLAYSASKSYQINYINSIRMMAKKEFPGLAITELRPGSVDTDMMKGEGHFWVSKPNEVAIIAYRAIQKKKKIQYLSGRWKMIGALLKFLSLWS